MKKQKGVVIKLDKNEKEIEELINKFKEIGINFCRNEELKVINGYRYDSFFRLENWNELHIEILYNKRDKNTSFISNNLTIYGRYDDNSTRKVHEIKDLPLDKFFKVVKSLKEGKLNEESKSIGLERCSNCGMWGTLSWDGENALCFSCYVFRKWFWIEMEGKDNIEKPIEEAIKRYNSSGSDEGGWIVKIYSLGDLIEFIDKYGDIILSKHSIKILKEKK